MVQTARALRGITGKAIFVTSRPAPNKTGVALKHPASPAQPTAYTVKHGEPLYGISHNFLTRHGGDVTPAAVMRNVGPLRAAKGLNTDFVLAMTGTPVENRLTDLWCISDVVQPPALESIKDFSVNQV